MKKTGTAIEDDLFALIGVSSLKNTISGSIYKDGFRPVGSNAEDVVVIFAGGLDGQFQDGIVIVNIFVPNINNGGTVKVKNTSRCRQLEIKTNDWLYSLKPTDYKFSLDAMIMSKQSPDIEQYYINVRIKFSFKTF